jgi:arsenite methyltransferase
MAERVFVTKLDRVGFDRITVHERFPFGLERTAGYPLFTTELVDLMYRLIPEDRHDSVATSVIITAAKGI